MNHFWFRINFLIRNKFSEKTIYFIRPGRFSDNKTMNFLKTVHVQLKFILFSGPGDLIAEKNFLKTIYSQRIYFIQNLSRADN